MLSVEELLFQTTTTVSKMLLLFTLPIWALFLLDSFSFRRIQIASNYVSSKRSVGHVTEWFPFSNHASATRAQLGRLSRMERVSSAITPSSLNRIPVMSYFSGEDSNLSCSGVHLRRARTATATATRAVDGEYQKERRCGAGIEARGERNHTSSSGDSCFIFEYKSNILRNSRLLRQPPRLRAFRRNRTE